MTDVEAQATACANSQIPFLAIHPLPRCTTVWGGDGCTGAKVAYGSVLRKSACGGLLSAFPPLHHLPPCCWVNVSWVRGQGCLGPRVKLERGHWTKGPLWPPLLGSGLGPLKEKTAESRTRPKCSMLFWFFVMLFISYFFLFLFLNFGEPFWRKGECKYPRGITLRELPSAFTNKVNYPFTHRIFSCLIMAVLILGNNSIRYQRKNISSRLLFQIPYTVPRGHDLSIRKKRTNSDINKFPRSLWWLDTSNQTASPTLYLLITTANGRKASAQANYFNGQCRQLRFADGQHGQLRILTREI